MSDKLLTLEQLAGIRERHRRDSNECADVKDADEIHNDRQQLLGLIATLKNEKTELLVYVSHDDECNQQWIHQGDSICTCGLGELLSEQGQ